MEKLKASINKGKYIPITHTVYPQVSVKICTKDVLVYYS